MNPYLAALLAAVPLVIIGVLYLYRAGRQFVLQLNMAGAEQSKLSEIQAHNLLLAIFLFAPIGLALLAAFLYTLLPALWQYQLLVFALALIAILFAIGSRQPLLRVKIAANLLVALSLGLLLPWLAA